MSILSDTQLMGHYEWEDEGAALALFREQVALVVADTLDLPAPRMGTWVQLDGSPPVGAIVTIELGHGMELTVRTKDFGPLPERED